MKARVLLTFAMILVALQAQGVTFQPPPPITSNTIFSFANSSIDSRLIWSPKLEILNLDTLTIPNGSATKATLTVFNRSSSTQSKTTYELILPGSWVHVESTVQDLSCSVLFESNTNTMGMVRWDRVSGTFKLLGALPLSTFTQDTVTLDQVRQAISVGQNCAVLAYVTSTITAVYRANADWTNIHLVVLPSNFNLQTVSPDLMWAISDNKIYKYDPNTFLYTELKTLPTHQRYMLQSQRNRVLVWAYNTNIVTNFTTYFDLQTNLTVWAFNYDQNNGVLNTAGMMTISNALERQQNPYSGIRIMASPQLSKFGFGYSLDGQTTLIKAKHVDYQTNQWYDLKFTDPVAYFSTVQNLQVDRQLDFNDFFLVVRNGTSTDMTDAGTIAASKPVEQGWQIVGSNFTMIRQRMLATDTTTYPPLPVTRQLSNFLKTFVDFEINDKLIILDVYAKTTSQYDLVEWDYGNLRSNNQIVKTPSTSYISYTEPTSTSIISTRDIYQWGYFHTVGANENLTVYSVDNRTVNHYRINQYELTGTGWSMVYQNKMCKILANSASITVNKEQEGVYVSTDDLFALLGGSVTQNSIWAASDDCTRVRLDGNFYQKDQGNNWAVITNPQGFTLDTVDANLTFALGTDGNLWKITPSGIVSYFTPPTAFPAGSGIFTWRSIVGLGKTTSTSAWFIGFTDSSSGLNKCINYSFTDFISTPTIYTSPKLTKVLVVGTANNPSYMSAGTFIKADLWVIQCPNSQLVNMPTDHLTTPANVRLNLGEQFLHLTKVDGSGVPTNDVVYYFKQGKVTLHVYDKTITVPADTVWVRSQIWRNSTSTVNYLLSEYIWTDPQSASNKKRIVNASEVNGQQAVFNSENNGSFTAQMVNGQVKLCPPGCSDCSCTTCISGFVADSATTSCRPCPPGCTACSSDASTCSGCVSGSFLNSSNLCAPCDPLCDTCSGSATSCTACPSGEFYASSQCNLCPHNCFECSDVNTCTTCREGFTVSSTGQCRGCAITCAKCNPNNITECTDCADGLFLSSNSQCQKCPEKCLSCGSSTVCGVCMDGYTTNTNGICVLECQLPCLTCLDNQPTKCTSCPYNSSPVNNVCVPSFACNSDSSCQSCGSGLNYYWTASGTGAICQPCPTISNCIQCNDLNTYKCSICSNGYYLDSSGACVACHSNCTACESDSICTGCQAGWTLKKGQTEGRCRACQSPCLTCQGNPKFCTSCITGFTKNGWKCKNDTYIQFQIVVTSTVAVVMTDIDNIICMIYAVMTGQNPSTIGTTCDKSFVTLDSLVAGSAVIVGSTSSPTSPSVTIPPTLGTYYVSSSTVTGYGAYATTEQSSQSKIGIIVGLVVGLTTLIVVIIVAVYCYKNRQSKVNSVQSESNIMVNSPEKRQVMEASGYEDSKELPENINSEIEI